MSNCPYCKLALKKIKVEEIKADSAGRKGMAAFSHACASCDTVLSVELHPNIYVALTTVKK